MLKIILKITGAAAIVIFVAFLFIVSYLLVQQQKEMMANITEKISIGLFDLSDYYRFSRVCVFPRETYWHDESYAGYTPIDDIFPDSHIYWTIVIIDDFKKEYRILIVDDRKVTYAGKRFCSRDARFVVRHVGTGVEAAPETTR